ncbi:DUF397 domain-containing protein [Actinomadura sp. 6N118]|uniref:DUF397 domain-containing protein n=1 Tax=Actinomadura sp. 6N118 TaxID=3375151 RepID=UPI003799A093
MDEDRVQWRKSSYSQGGQGECVEVSTNLAGVALIRDSKDPAGDSLRLGAGALAGFLAQVKAGRFG